MKTIGTKNAAKRMAALCAAAVLTVFMGADAVSASFASTYTDTDEIYVTVNTKAGHKPISPYIYGISADSDFSGATVNALKQTDPRLSSYNWETNMSNSAGGRNSTNSLDMVGAYPPARQSEPALLAEALVSKARLHGVSSRYVTLQMMGAAAGRAGRVNADEPEIFWNTVYPLKHDTLLSEPDLNDNAVYMEEYVSFLVNKYGYAVDGGINGYFLDNEPENWSKLYPSAMPQNITAKELVDRSAELAEAAKRIDPTALVYGPSIDGIEAFINLKNPSDWDRYSQEYSWFIDYYLASMKAASQKAGVRLLDVLDVHYRTEATNGLLESIIDSSDNFSNNTRLQAPRILWDSSYTENSNIAIMYNQHIPLIPTLEASINMYYPKTKLSFSQYNFGGGGDISGGISTADTLGIFAEYGVHMACLAPNSEDISYQKSAINIYTNYDGLGGSFGNTLVRADNGGDHMSSVYAAIEGNSENTLRTVIMNKNRYKSKTAEFTINSDEVFDTAEVYSFDSESPAIVRADRDIVIEDNSFVFEMEPLTVYMLVFGSAEEVISTGTDPSGTETGGSTDSDTENEETTLSVPEHVEAETYSSVKTTSVSEEDTSVSEDDISVTGEDTSVSGGTKNTEPPENSVTSVTLTDAEQPPANAKSVPKAVKTAVIALVCAVAVGMGYVVIEDVVLNKKSGK